MYKILISGYYGFNNIGDEAILKGLLEGIRSRLSPVDILVLSKFPDFTAKKHDVRAINRINLFKIFREMRSMDMLVSGGGSLFQDVTSKRSIAYYLGIIWLAKRVFRKKVMIYSQGIGPVTKKYNRYLLAKMLNQIDVINVRDEKSKAELISLGVTKEILVTTDTVFNICKPPLEKGKALLQKIDSKNHKPYIGISVRYWEANDQKICLETAKLCELLVEKTGHRPVLIPFHFHRDLQLMRKIYATLPQSIRGEVLLMEEYLYVEDYLSLVGNLDIMVGMRLHGLIFATLMEVYPIGISYDPKIQSFMKILRRQPAMEVSQIDAESLCQEVMDALENLQEKRKDLSENLATIKTTANEHNDKLIELLEA